MNDFTGERTVNCVDRPDGTRLFDDVTNIQGAPAAPINRDETNTAIVREFFMFIFLFYCIV